MTSLLSTGKAIRILPPLSHEAMITAMRRSDLLLSDSGGMQEEAPALGIPMLVMRRRTERAESLHANLIYSPMPKLDIGAELIWGRRELEDAREGDLRRLHAHVKYSF